MEATTSNAEKRSDYDVLRAFVEARVLSAIASGQKLFTTSARGLYELYLTRMPSALRQHHTCRACRDFIERYGGLATIDEKGGMHSAVWPISPMIGSDYATAVANMKEEVENAAVTGVFLSAEATWGKPETGAWTHFAARLHAPIYKAGALTAGQAMAEKKQDWINVKRALSEFPLDVVGAVVSVLAAEAVTRSEKFVAPARWLLDLHVACKGLRGKRRDNAIWRAVASAPAGFCHPRSGVLGSLMEDLAGGVPLSEASVRFAAKVSPAQYQRPQAAPSAGNIQQAEKLVAALGIAPSLERRFARLEDLEKLWVPTSEQPDERATGVFGHLRALGASPTSKLVMPSKTMTWVKFRDALLPDARKMRLRVPFAGNFGALVTAVRPDAPLIFHWDNPTSWYVYVNESTAQQWHLKPNAMCDVTALVLQPSMWGARPLPQHGESVFFILRGAVDQQNKSLALFPEILRGDLHSVRSTIEAHSQSGKLAGAEDADACGLRLMRERHGDVFVEMEDHRGNIHNVTIDRWD